MRKFLDQLQRQDFQHPNMRRVFFKRMSYALLVIVLVIGLLPALSVGARPAQQTTNLALTRPVVCSSIEFPCADAVDGNAATRWASLQGVDPQWIYVDLGATYSISRVVLTWEAAYGRSYQIQTSGDAATWTAIYTTTTGDGGTDDLTGLSGSGRYVRMNGTVRGTGYGYSLWEFQVYGTSGAATATRTNTSVAVTATRTFTPPPAGPTNTPTSGASPTRTNTPGAATFTATATAPSAGCGTTNVALNKAATASSALGGNTAPMAVDGNVGTRWESVHAVDPQWMQIDLGSTQSICRVKLTWEGAYATAYQIQTSNDAATWATIYSTTTGDGSIDDLTGLAGSGRYVRMNGTARGTAWGYSLWEFDVYSGSSGVTNTPTSGASPTRTNTPAIPTNTPAGTIYNQQASNDSVNITYSFSYGGVFTYYRVYIDTDQSAATGYNANGIGANYMVENGAIFSHPANDSTWSWTSLGAVTYTNSGTQASWTIARSAIGETSNPNAADLIFQVEAPLTTSAKYTHTYSGGGGPTSTPSGGSTTVTYTANTAIITNPERGFLHTNTVCESSLYNMATLQGYRNNENISLLLCNFYLTSFKTSPISQAALNALQTQLNTIRSAGLKVVLRFAYTQTDNVDASLSQIIAHIDQLAPIIQSNSDVIYLWQAGFIGEWGEWYYTNHFGDMGVISPQQWADRKAVVDKMLAVLPSTRMVSLRTPLFMRTMYGTTTVASGTAFNGSAIARLGQHNDAFVASPDDMGTYSNTSVEYPWLQAQTAYTPIGGENAAWAPPRSDCTTALQEMGLFHWSYANIDYLGTTITNWNSQGCLTTMKKNLGYRFVLTQGTYPNTASAGGPLNIQISIRNDGFAAPFNPRGRELILRNTSTSALYRFALTSDPRFWLAGTTTNINQTFTLPANIPAGNYALLLNLPDPSSALITNPQYSIQTANIGTWESNTGFNNLLKTVIIP